MRRSTMPSWVTAGDLIALALLGVIFLLGFFSYGLVREGWLRGIAFGACALLGCWSVIGWAAGRWERYRLRPARWVVLLLAFVLVVGAVQLVPKGAGAGIHTEIVESSWMFESPQRKSTPAAIAPHAARGAWHQIAASLMLFAGIALVATRRLGALAVALVVAGFSLVEGFIGIVRFALEDQFRGAGALYNPNHHAAAVIMGMPLFFGLIFYTMRTTDRFSAPLLSGRNPLLLAVVAGLVVLISWVAAFSRGSLFFGSIIFAAWLIHERHMMKERSRRGRRSSLSTMMRTGTAVVTGLVGAVLLSALFSRAFHDRLMRAGAIGTADRTSLWEAALRGLMDAPMTGLGLGGTRYAINRYAEIPLIREPIHAHNEYIEWLADLGIPASLAILVIGVMFAMSWWEGWLSADPESEVAILRRASLAGLLTVMCHSAVDFPLRVPVIGFAALAMLAITMARKWKRREETEN